jgi:hypothetical protein
MARKTINYTVEAEGRDHGKVFVITEWDADRSEDWAFRVLLALFSNNVEMPEGFETLGMAGLAQMGLKALTGLKHADAKPLLAELFECVQIRPDPKNPQVIRHFVNSDTEEVMTRVNLRMEVLKVHIDFSQAAGNSIFGQAKKAAAVVGRVTRTSQR